jgi:hypothetical protein
MMIEYGIDSTFARSFRIDLDGLAFALALPCLGGLEFGARSLGYIATVLAWVLGSHEW